MHRPTLQRESAKGEDETGGSFPHSWLLQKLDPPSATDISALEAFERERAAARLAAAAAPAAARGGTGALVLGRVKDLSMRQTMAAGEPFAWDRPELLVRSLQAFTAPLRPHAHFDFLRTQPRLGSPCSRPTPCPAGVPAVPAFERDIGSAPPGASKGQAMKSALWRTASMLQEGSQQVGPGVQGCRWDDALGGARQGPLLRQAFSKLWHRHEQARACAQLKGCRTVG